MATVEQLSSQLAELSRKFDELSEQHKRVLDENVSLKKKMGIRNFLQTSASSASVQFDENMDTRPTENSSQPGQPTKAKKPPPFFVSGVRSFSMFKKLIELTEITPHEIKSLANNEIKITVNTADDYRKLRKILSDLSPLTDHQRKELGQVKFHTYRLSEDKPFTVFIRGLHHSTELKDISSELAAFNHQVTNIINVHIKKRADNKTNIVKLPLFKVDLKVSDNNREVFDVQNLCYSRITVEMPRKTESLPQCKRCQDYGHTTNYCTKTPKCVKCGERHLIKDCQLPKSAPPRCANCKSEHTANYKGCPYYQSKIAATKNVKSPSATDRVTDSAPPNRPTHASIAASTASKGSTVHVNRADKSQPKSESTSDTKQILEILQRMETNLTTLEKKFTFLEQRVMALEAPQESPKRKSRKK